MEWNIQSRAHACQGCKKAFADKDPFHTILFDEKSGYERFDVCESCWKEQYSQGAIDRKGFVSYWQSIYTVPSAAPPDAIHPPSHSLFPIVLAAGLLLAGIGAVTRLAVVAIAFGVVVLAVLGFAFERPAFGEDESGEIAAAGVDNRKLGMWAFIGSESIFFASLISTYLIYKGRSVTGPSPQQILEVPLTSFSTFVLLMSSLLMVLALAALQRGAERASRRWLFGTAGLGLVFLAAQAYEFTHFYHEGLALQTNLFGQTFYTLDGFHGAHVTIGVLWILALAAASFAGKLPARRCLAVELCGIYWHFVDVVWIVIFTLVYLFEGVSGA